MVEWCSARSAYCIVLMLSAIPRLFFSAMSPAAVAGDDDAMPVTDYGRQDRTDTGIAGFSRSGALNLSLSRIAFVAVSIRQ